MDTTESRTFAARLADLLRNERHALAEFLLALAEFDRQRGWLELGYSGLFPFLHRELKLCKGAAFSRMTAAELIQRYAEMVEPLRDGRLCLSTMGSLAKVLTPVNCADVLPRFFHLSGLEAKALVAELAPVPNPPIRTVVTVTPARVAPTAVVPHKTEDRGSRDEPLCLEGTGAVTAATVAPPRPAPAQRFEVEPLTPTVTRIHMSISPAFLEKLESARLALSHSMPGADAEAILTAGLDLLLARDAKRKGLVAKPRPAPAGALESADPDHVPADVRRKVWNRDGGCCQWQVDSGGVCGSRLRLELDHIVPKAQGGKSTVSNLRILCAAHNRLAARQELGDRLMNRYGRDPRQPELLGVAVAVARGEEVPAP